MSASFVRAILLAAWCPLFAFQAQAEEDLVSRTVTINTLGFYTTWDGQPAGVMTPVDISVAQHARDRMRIAFVEDEIDGFGEMWRAAAWVSNVVAADLSGTNPSNLQITFERSGRVDGPSAGGLMTVGVLAALRGDPLRNDTAMTGTINPDGTIGPVGGIPQKIEGAAAAGMKQVLVPYGQRTGFDQKKKADVDLIEHGQRLGVKVQMVGDIFQAYELLTGAKLPRQPPAATPQLDSDTYQHLRLKVDEWLFRYREFKATYNKVPERFRSDYCVALMEIADSTAGGIDRLTKEGQVAAAFREALRSAILAGLAAEIGNTIWVDQVRGRETAKKYARTFARINEKVRIAVDRLKQFEPKNMGEAGILIYGFSALCEALSYRAAAEALLDGQFDIVVTDENADPEEETILSAAYAMQIASLDCDHIRDLLEIAGDLEGRPAPDQKALEDTAEFLRRGAEANLNQFEKVVVNERARNNRVSYDVMRYRVMQDDESYLIARLGERVARPTLRQMLADDPALPYAELGAAIRTYSLSSLLLASHYSLGVQQSDEGEIVGVEREGSLQFMLDFALDQARRNIQLLKEHDVDPASAVFAYRASSLLSGRELPDRIEALGWLWEANTQARVLAHLGGFAGEQ